MVVLRLAGKAEHRPGYSSTAARAAKARKIQTILAHADFPLTRGTRVLDLGTGSGDIARNLAHTAGVIACDIVDQRTQRDGPPFVITDQALPFPDGSFDIVVSNHVIEHTRSPQRHLQEIHRVLKPGGVAYLATPNRLWPREFHTRLLLLHFLPAAWFLRISKALGHGDELLQLQTPGTLERSCGECFRVEWWHHRLLRNPTAYALTLPAWARRILRLTPDRALAATRNLQPTLICLLHRRQTGPACWS
jgi:SAM-dependent methyltransferase